MVSNLRILDVVGVEHVATHPVECKANEDNVHSEYRDRYFVPMILTEKTGREWYEGDEHEEKGVDIGQHMIHILGIDRDEEVMRSPVGKEEGKREHV